MSCFHNQYQRGPIQLGVRIGKDKNLQIFGGKKEQVDHTKERVGETYQLMKKITKKL